jgi:Asp-tRNA(Asn)/Glu-tRNA(Gln) amidotransferase A subunit family amidase
MDLLSSACDLRRAIDSRKLSPAELMAATIDAVHNRNPELGAIATVVDEAATAQAEAATRAWRDASPPLFGLPITVKDTIEVAGVRSTGGSRLLSDHFPQRTAPAVATLLRAGAILLGKSNCPEFGIGNLDTSNEIFGQTRNPWDLTRSPGGSSGGDSAAVAAGLSAIGVGTDYGGSVRFPAHCTGIAALRPTPGSVNGEGVLPITSREIPVDRRPKSVQAQLQTIGFQARSVADLQLLAGVLGIGGPTEAPSRCAWFVEDRNVTAQPEIAAVVEACAQALTDEGFVTTGRRPPLFDRANFLLTELRHAEGQPEIEQLSQGRRDELTALVAAELGKPPAPARPGLFEEIDDVRRAVLKFLNTWPILLTPVGTEPAFPIDEPARSRSDLEAFCRAVTLLRLPAAVVTCGTAADGMPIGVQVVGRPRRDGEVLAVAALLEAAFGRWRPSSKG